MEFGIEDVQALNEQKKKTVVGSQFIMWKGILMNMSYVTPNFVLMCTPSDKDIIKRNGTHILAAYIHEKCGSHFHVINLMEEEEQMYDEAILDNKCTKFPCPDHCSPTLEYYDEVVNFIMKLYSEDPQITLFVHCKAGRGRSGTIFAAYAMKTGMVITSDQAISILNNKRATDGLSVTIPSQIRFLQYYQYKTQNGNPHHQVVQIDSIEFCPSLPKQGVFQILRGIPVIGERIYENHFDGCSLFGINTKVTNEFVLQVVYDGDKTDSVRCQLHSDYLIEPVHKIVNSTIVFSKNELDGPHHRARGNQYPEGLTMKLCFSVV